jgi:hypothetical protein
LEICHGIGKETRQQGDSLQMAAPKPKFPFFFNNMKPMCKTGTEQTVFLQKPPKKVAKEFHMEAQKI